MRFAAVINTIVVHCFIFRKVEAAIGALDAIHRLHLFRFSAALLILAPQMADNEEYPKQGEREEKKPETHPVDSL
jgi:hypothetical protein